MHSDIIVVSRENAIRKLPSAEYICDMMPSVEGWCIREEHLDDNKIARTGAIIKAKFKDIIVGDDRYCEVNRHTVSLRNLHDLCVRTISDKLSNLQLQLSVAISSSGDRNYSCMRSALNNMINIISGKQELHPVFIYDYDNDFLVTLSEWVEQIYETYRHDSEEFYIIGLYDYHV